jgi:hypothetical protein
VHYVRLLEYTPRPFLIRFEICACIQPDTSEGLIDLLQDVHTVMTNEYGIPVWGSYIIFAVATILLGLLIGLVSNHVFQLVM